MKLSRFCSCWALFKQQNWFECPWGGAHVEGGVKGIREESWVCMPPVQAGEGLAWAGEGQFSRGYSHMQVSFVAGCEVTPARCLLPSGNKYSADQVGCGDDGQLDSSMAEVLARSVRQEGKEQGNRVLTRERPLQMLGLRLERKG